MRCALLASRLALVPPATKPESLRFSQPDPPDPTANAVGDASEHRLECLGSFLMIEVKRMLAALGPELSCRRGT